MAQLTQAQLMAEVARLQAENKALQEKANKALTLKVSPKGAVSIYGFGRFPVTLYKAQMKRLLAEASKINAFMADNDAALVSK